MFVDGLDFFEIDTRRHLFREARRRGIWAITAGPIGFSAAWLVFSPTGMSFDQYFDLNDRMDRADRLVAFLVGLTPRATQRAYLDLTQVDPRTGTGPSAGLACHLCSGVVAAEIFKILLGRSPIRPAPWYFQFDSYRQRLCKGRLHGGNRHPWQRAETQDRPEPPGPAGLGQVGSGSLREGSGMDTSLVAIVTAAGRAPSGDNTQPCASSSIVTLARSPWRKTRHATRRR